MANLIPLANSSLVKPKKSAIVKANKLLGENSKSSAIVKADKNQLSKLVSSTEKSSQTEKRENILSQIEKKVNIIDKLLKDFLLLSKKNSEKSRLTQERDEFKNKEKELEKKIKPKEKSGINLPSLPKMGFLDWIKNFVLNTFLGFISVRLIDFLPHLLKILPTIIGAGEFLIDWGGKLLNGLVTFIDWGYKAYDGTRGFLKNLGGDGLANNFDKFSGAIGNLIDVLIFASIATMGMDSGDGGAGGRGGRRGFDSQGRRVGKDVQRRYAQRYGKNQFVDRFGKKNLQNLTGGARRGVFQKGARSAFTGLAGKGGAKAILKFVKPLVSKIPIIGGLIEFGLSWALGEPIGKAAFRGIGAVLVGAIGTAIGGPIGAFLGSWAGGEAGGVLYDMFFGNKKPKKGKVAKAAGGGMPSVRGKQVVSRSPRRTIRKKKAPKVSSFTPRKIRPGANTGGEASVQKVFPNPEKPKGFFGWLGGLFGNNQQQQAPVEPKKPKGKVANPQEFLVKSNDVLGRAKYFIGPTATLVLKTVVGQEPDEIDYKNIAKGLSSFMQTTFSGGTLAFAGGGEVDAKQYFGGEDYTDVIEKSVKDSVSKEVNATIRNLVKEISLKPAVGREEMIQQNIERGTESTEGMQDAAMSESEMNLFQRLVYAESGGEGKIGMALVARSVLNRAGLIQSGKASLGTFLAKDKTITGVIMGPKQYTPVSNGRINEKRSQKQMNDAKEAIKLAQNPDQLRAALKSEGIDDGSIKKLLASTGFRNYNAGAGYDASQAVNEIRYKRHTFNTAGNKALIVASSQVSEYSGEKISGVREGGGKAVFGETGNVSNSPGWVHGHFQGSSPNAVVRDTAGVVKSLLRQGSPMYLKPGVDLTPGKKYSDAEILKFVEGARRAHTHSGTGSSIDVFVKRGTKVPVPLTNIGPSGSGYGGYGRGGLAGYIPGTNTWIGHLDPSSTSSSRNTRVASRFHGGPILKTGLLLAHKGEFVIDKDSVDLFGFDFIDSINRVENSSQLIAQAPSIIEKLKTISGYPYYNDYENQEPKIIYVEVPVEVSDPNLNSAGSVNYFIGNGIDNNTSRFEVLNGIG